MPTNAGIGKPLDPILRLIKGNISRLGWHIAPISKEGNTYLLKPKPRAGSDITGSTRPPRLPGMDERRNNVFSRTTARLASRFSNCANAPNYHSLHFLQAFFKDIAHKILQQDGSGETCRQADRWTDGPTNSGSASRSTWDEFTVKENWIWWENDGNPISLQECACKETTYP